ncbi:DNA-binding transcription factor Adn3 [Schizosaccharomyces pombe]|uniref:Adhesion defective protein 3 n=1 Tax=Schizosaccharomyces pombe (strain 972 / ATCC 24843) TaxID=284812 RepID=ADN3_SCHPO|nr:putative transcription factor [Schizosaccharomyces pombe]O74522.1 RecName: Full=Adhesion defective protein 3; AltName: Full=LisH domain-containing protein adn3 [Schizosaccharomyces pombe 972h-]CAA19308.2 transcription factor (predicted) [Schizosaccharomyces pombe]|eukprot:NP_588535.2 putative transcription factor [Schizosaccharomyces pombe]
MADFMDIEPSSHSAKASQYESSAPASSSLGNSHPNESLDYYIYDYFVKHNFEEAAQAFLRESKIQIPKSSSSTAFSPSNNNAPSPFPPKNSSLASPSKISESISGDRLYNHMSSAPSPNKKEETNVVHANEDISLDKRQSFGSSSLPPSEVSINVPEGFLVEWFNIFWDVFSARVSRVNSTPIQLYDPSTQRQMARPMSNLQASQPVPSSTFSRSAVVPNPSLPLNPSVLQGQVMNNPTIPKGTPSTSIEGAKTSIPPSHAMQNPHNSFPASADRLQKNHPVQSSNFNPYTPAPSITVPPNYIPNTAMMGPSYSSFGDTDPRTYPAGMGPNPTAARNGFYPPTPAQIHQLKAQQQHLQRQSKQMSEPAPINMKSNKDQQLQYVDFRGVGSGADLQKQQWNKSTSAEGLQPNGLVMRNFGDVRHQKLPTSSPPSQHPPVGQIPSQYLPYQAGLKVPGNTPIPVKQVGGMPLQSPLPVSMKPSADDHSRATPTRSVEAPTLPSYAPRHPTQANGSRYMNPSTSRMTPQSPYMQNYYRPHAQMQDQNNMMSYMLSQQKAMEIAKSREMAIQRNTQTLSSGNQPPQQSGPNPNEFSMSMDPANMQQGNHALSDYHMQLMLLEEQNKKRLMMARQEQGTGSLSPQSYMNSRYSVDVGKEHMSMIPNQTAPMIQPNVPVSANSPAQANTPAADSTKSGTIQPTNRNGEGLSYSPHQQFSPSAPQAEKLSRSMSPFVSQQQQLNQPVSNKPDGLTQNKEVTGMPLNKEELTNPAFPQSRTSWMMPQSFDTSSLNAPGAKDSSSFSSLHAQPGKSGIATMGVADNTIRTTERSTFSEIMKDSPSAHASPGAKTSPNASRAPEPTGGTNSISQDTTQSLQMQSNSVNSSSMVDASKSKEKSGGDTSALDSNAKNEPTAAKPISKLEDDALFNDSAGNAFGFSSKTDSNVEMLNDFDFESFLNDAGADSASVYY